MNDQVERVDDDVELDQCIHCKGNDVRPSATLRSVSESQDELQEEERQVDVLDNCVQDWCDRVAEWECSLVVGRARSTDKVNDDSRSQVVRSYEEVSIVVISLTRTQHTQGEPRQSDSGNVVDQLDVEEEHAQDVVP